jgi:glutamyl-Q tRNA(Asp) synthetase
LSWTELSAEYSGTGRAIEAHPQQWGDVVLARKDVPTSYHLSVVVDDAAQGVSHVVRGRDLYEATSIQRLLQQLLGFEPPVYFHHHLVEGADGRKLSKSENDTGLRRLREAGATPADIRRMIAMD